MDKERISRIDFYLSISGRTYIGNFCSARLLERDVWSIYFLSTAISRTRYPAICNCSFSCFEMFLGFVLFVLSDNALSWWEKRNNDIQNETTMFFQRKISCLTDWFLIQLIQLLSNRKVFYYTSEAASFFNLPLFPTWKLIHTLFILSLQTATVKKTIYTYTHTPNASIRVALTAERLTQWRG